MILFSFYAFISVILGNICVLLCQFIFNEIRDKIKVLIEFNVQRIFSNVYFQSQYNSL